MSWKYNENEKLVVMTICIILFDKINAQINYNKYGLAGKILF